mmetsp:Transcript_46885/g.105699  ORF Transcript_46885/g.105699 Transcript_46885/m.105699 type:complete len:106 (-) Transcript_46885:1214-1531(-)
MAPPTGKRVALAVTKRKFPRPLHRWRSTPKKRERESTEAIGNAHARDKGNPVASDGTPPHSSTLALIRWHQAHVHAALRPSGVALGCWCCVLRSACAHSGRLGSC